MSCTPVTPAMLELLEFLAGYPNGDTKSLRILAEWEQARTRGWLMESGELTGSAWRHVTRNRAESSAIRPARGLFAAVSLREAMSRHADSSCFIRVSHE